MVWEDIGRDGVCWSILSIVCVGLCLACMLTGICMLTCINMQMQMHEYAFLHTNMHAQVLSAECTRTLCNCTNSQAHKITNTCMYTQNTQNHQHMHVHTKYTKSITHACTHKIHESLSDVCTHTCTRMHSRTCKHLDTQTHVTQTH